MFFPDISPEMLIIGGAAIFSILVLFIILFIFFYQKRLHRHYQEKRELHNTYQQEILRTQLETQEMTFHQIGEELHDNIGQLLSSTRMLIGIAERSLENVPKTLKTADQTLAQAIHDLRMLSKSLNKEWLSRFNLLENLQAEVDRINSSKTVGVTLHANKKTIPLNAESRVMLFRIIQEALNNSIKHSRAASIRLDIDMNEHIIVQVRDDGRGMLGDDTQPGVGLMNMKHRTALLGGTITWTSPAGTGTTVTIQLPIQPEEL